MNRRLIRALAVTGSVIAATACGSAGRSATNPGATTGASTTTPASTTLTATTALTAPPGSSTVPGSTTVSTTVAPGGPATSAPAGPGHARVTMTRADDGRTIELHVGDRIDGVFRADPGHMFAVPALSVPGILRAVPNPAATAVIGTRLVSYVAVAPGTVVVSTYQTMDCPPNALCSQLATTPLRITIHVS